MRAKLIASLLGLALLTGCSSAPKMIEVPDVTSMAGDAAQDAIEEAGFESEFDAGEDSVWMASNWTVMSQDPAAGTKAEDGATVTLVVGKPSTEEFEPAEEEVAPPAAPVPPAAPTTTPSGLSAGVAVTTCDRYGSDQATFGWNADFLLDGTRMIEGDTYVLKAGVSITNAYGTEGRYTVDCVVGGSDAAPVVVSFNVY